MKKVLLLAVSLTIILAGFGAWLLVQRELSLSTAAPSAPPAYDIVTAKLQKMSLREKAASLLMLHTPGTNQATLADFTDTYQPGGMIMMGDSIPDSSAAIIALSETLRGGDTHFPRLVAVDQEGGVVSRLSTDQFGSVLDLRGQPVRATAAAFDARSMLVRSSGITVNFGIVADVTDDPNSFIYDRVLGVTPQTASPRVAAAVRATSGKTLSTIKHFPGHGETAADSHSSVPTVSTSFNDWQRRDRPSFQAGIDAGADMVMMGHLRYNAVDSKPASLSKKWHQILRHEMDFRGVIVTDDMVMLQDSGERAYADPVTNAVTALQAGSGLLLYVLDNGGSPSSMIDPDTLIDGIVAAVKDGRLSSELMDQAVERLLVMRHRTAALVP